MIKIYITDQNPFHSNYLNYGYYQSLIISDTGIFWKIRSFTPS